MDENEILEMGRTMKLKYEELEEKERKMKMEVRQLKKALISAYGWIRIIDETFSVDLDMPQELNTTIELLRQFLSDHTERFIQ